MFDFFTKKQSITNAFEFLGIDLHSHLVPWVDDGVQSKEEAIHLLNELQSLGFSKFILTPHISKIFFPNSNETLNPPFEGLKNIIGSNCQLYLSAEYLMDENFEEIIAKKELIAFPKKQILVETSFIGLDLKIKNYIFSLLSLGYAPILAHPERYLYMATDNAKTLRELVNLGCKLQININSFMGLYGKNVKEFSLWLLDNIQIDYLGTDLHNVEQLAMLKKLPENKAFLNKLSNYNWKNSELLD